MQLILSSPWWFIGICLLAGLVYAYVLYQPKWGLFWSKILAITRFAVVSTLCFLLLSPVLVRQVSNIQKPIIIMAMDNSQSIKAGKDSNFYSQNFPAEWRKVKAFFGNDYDVQFINFGNNVTTGGSFFYNEKRTNIGNVYQYINNAYVKQNIGAVILATDGIYNVGSNPLYKNLENNALLYTIGLGDSSIKKDAIVKNANANAIAYLGNDFPLEVSLAAYTCKGANATLTISSNGKTLFTKPINYQTNDYFETHNFNITATEPGTKHIVVSLSTIEGEISKVNNRKDVFIDVIDGREKILLAYYGSHPDVGALKEAIQSNINYEVIAKQISEVKAADLMNYSVVILHQLPTRNFPITEIINTCKTKQIPLWTIVGSLTAIEYLPNISPLARIDKNQGRLNEAQATLNTNFNLFTLEDNTKTTISSLPPLKVPYGSYAGVNADILTYQKIGNIDTKLPLWAFANQNNEKMAFTFGEGFWQWRLIDFVKNENHLATNELISKTIQYLAVKEDKQKFRVYPIKNVYEEDEAVKFIAELYNSNYELINTTDVKLTLTNANNKNFDYTFSPNGKAYQLDLGILPAGLYQYKAKAQGITETITGKLLITPLQAELVNTTANFGLLRQMAAKHNGSFYGVKDFEKALKAVKENTNITSISYSEKKIEDLINLKWLFFIVLLFIAFEWFVRKYEGGY